MRVLIFEPAYDRIRARLHAAVPGLDVLVMRPDGSLWLGGEPVGTAEAEPVVAWPNTDVYAGGPVREFMIACLKSSALRWVQSSAAGFDHPVFSMLVDKGVKLSNSHGAAVAIAEFVLASVLDCYHPQRLRRELQAGHRWERTTYREVSGTTWLVIGMGHIGCEVARRARAFGARVVGVRRTPHGDEPADQMLSPREIPAHVGQADVVVVAASANQDSVHLVDSDFLSRMRPGSVLVNIARGALVDEDALLASLARGVPEHAVLDVFATEPLPGSSPLWDSPRVRVTAHNAAASDGLARRNDELFVGNLARFVRGEGPSNLVDPALVRASVQGNQ
jgi:phosphoglycerate dehydrogenase-like enzyme